MQKQADKSTANAAEQAEAQTKERIHNAAPYRDEVQYSHEIELLGAPEEGLYMLYLRIQSVYMNMRVLLAGPMIKTVAEQQQMIRANQMTDAMIEKTQRLANGE